MAVTLSSLAGAAAQFFDNNGVPLAGGLIYTYLAGTNTPAATYTSSTGLIAHSNPIVLDAAGRIATGEVWLTSGVDYKFVVKTSVFVQLGSYDNIPSINDFTSIYAALANTTNAALGDALVGFRQSNSAGNLSGAVGRTVHQKLQESISVKDFGAVGNGTVDDTAAFAAAFAAAGLENFNIFLPSGKYRLTSTLTIPTGVALTGEFWPRVDTTIGSWLYFDHTNVGLTAITDTVTIAKLGTVRNQPSPYTVGFTPTANDWDITLSGDDYLISEVMLLNPTKGIQIQQGGRVTIEKLNGEPLTIGIEIVSSSDTSYLNQIHFWPFWSAALPEVEAWKKANATAFYSRRNDNPQWIKLFCNSYKYGLRIGYNDSAVTGFGVSGTTYAANISQINVDGGVTFLEVDSDSDACALNIVQFSSGGYWPLQSQFPFSGVNILGTNGRFFFTNAAIVEVGKASVNVAGTGNIVVFDGLQTGGYGYADLPSPPTTKNIEASAGNAVFIESYWTQSTQSTAYFASTITFATVSVNAYNKEFSRFVNLGAALPRYSQEEVGQNFSGYEVEQPGARRYKFGVPVGDTAYKILDSTGSELIRYELSAAGDHTFLGNTNTTTASRFVIQASNGTARPGADNTQFLGSASFRWSEVFAGNGTINTSDGREKEQIRNINETEKLVAQAVKGLLKAFKFKSSVESKGDSARIHFGVIAQDVKSAFEAEGLYAEDYGLFCYNEWQAEPEKLDEHGNVVVPALEAGNRYGIRYEQLLAFIIGAM